MTYSSRSVETSGKPTAEGFGGADERILGLLAIAEDQQTAVRAGIEGMALERAAFAKERVALVQQAEEIRRLSEKLANVTLQAIPLLAESAGQAARSAVDKALAGTAETAVEVAAAAAQPTLDGFKEAVSSASTVQLELRKAVKDFRRDWMLVVACAMATAVLAAAFTAYGATWLQERELEQLVAQRDQLTAEVNALQRQVEQGRRGGTQRPAK